MRTSQQHVQSRQKYQWNSGGIHEVERIGDGDDLRASYGDQLAITAVNCIAQHRKLRAKILMSGHALLAVIAEVHGRQQHARTRLEIDNVLAALDYFAGNVAA